MGSGIATALLLGNIRVILKEVNAALLSKGLKSIEGSSSHLTWFVVYSHCVFFVCVWREVSLAYGSLDTLSFHSIFPVYDTISVTACSVS